MIGVSSSTKRDPKIRMMNTMSLVDARKKEKRSGAIRCPGKFELNLLDFCGEIYSIWFDIFNLEVARRMIAMEKAMMIMTTTKMMTMMMKRVAVIYPSTIYGAQTMKIRKMAKRKNRKKYIRVRRPAHRRHPAQNLLVAAPAQARGQNENPVARETVGRHGHAHEHVHVHGPGTAVIVHHIQIHIVRGPGLAVDPPRLINDTRAADIVAEQKTKIQWQKSKSYAITTNIFICILLTIVFTIHCKIRLSTITILQSVKEKHPYFSNVVKLSFHACDACCIYKQKQKNVEYTNS